MRYGYRVTGWESGRGPTGLIGLATSPARAQRLAASARGSTRIRRERWSDDLWEGVHAEEERGRIPRSLALTLPIPDEA